MFRWHPQTPSARRATRDRLVAILLCAFLPLSAGADDPPLSTHGEHLLAGERPGWRIEVRQWVSDGSTKTSHNARMLAPELGNPTSRLHYRKARSNITEASVRWDIGDSQNWVQATGGSGRVRSGNLRDDDFVSALGAQTFGTSVQGEHRFSSTDSSLKGDNVRYLDLTVGRRVIEAADGSGRASVFGSYAEWRERYVARGVVQRECTAPGTLCAPAGFSGFFDRNVITDRVRWRSLFIGIEGDQQMSERLRARASVAYAPRARLQNDDTHHLRSDLRQDPSFSQRGDGDAVRVDVDFEMRLTPNFAAHLGMRYWRAKVSGVRNGFRAHPVGGPDRIEADLNEFRTERKGLVVGLSYSPVR